MSTRDCPLPAGVFLTVHNRKGREVLARFYGEDIGILVFKKSQLAKAQALVRKHGSDWEVVALPSGTGFIVGRKTISEIQAVA